MTRISDSLERVLARHRLVFWYDPRGEWSKAFEDFEGAGATKLKVEGTEFSTKVAIHRDSDPEARYLLYFPSERPKDMENWLLDLLLQGHEYKADRASLILQEVGLPYDFREVIEAHIGFFGAKQIQALAPMLTPAEEARTLRLKMMAVLTGTEADVDSLLLAFLSRGPVEALLDPAEDALGAANLVDAFWREVGAHFGYVSETPTLRDFATALFRWANPLDSGVTFDPHARVFLQTWKDSQKYSPAFREWSKALEADLHVSDQLDALDDAGKIERADAFAAFEKFIIYRLCRGFEKGTSTAALAAVIEARRGSFWHGDHEDAYQALTQAIRLRELLNGTELHVDSLDTGIGRYLASWHEIDASYRRFCYYQRRYGQVAVMQCVTDWVEKTYVNTFLLPLADQWSDRVRVMGAWGSEKLPMQTRFFGHFVRPFLDRGQKVFVVVSDSLRYEAAAELVSRIQAENRWTAELDAVLASLPSYTQLGMASLLPGEKRELQPADGTVLVDGKNAAGTEARRQILAAALAGKATAIQAEVFLEMNTKTEARALLRDHDVVYIFHNTIDKVGDSPATEAKTADAVQTALAELMQILRKIANANGNNMVLTADHGFLFQQSEVAEADDLPLPVASEWLMKNRRFALGRNIAKNPAVKTFAAQDLGLAGDWEAAFPLALGRFPLSGSGKRYVHGGLSLQEVIVPVVRIHKARSDDVERVEVDILRAPNKITTGRLTLALYQSRPAVDKTLPRTLSAGVYALDGTVLSEVGSLTFDLADEEPRLREKSVVLTLSRAADDYNGQEVDIRLQETIPGTSQTTTYKSHRVKLYKRFESDFDD